VVVTPTEDVTIGGVQTVSWLEIDSASGNVSGVLEDGTRSADFFEDEAARVAPITAQRIILRAAASVEVAEEAVAESEAAITAFRAALAAAQRAALIKGVKLSAPVVASLLANAVNQLANIAKAAGENVLSAFINLVSLAICGIGLIIWADPPLEPVEGGLDGPNPDKPSNVAIATSQQTSTIAGGTVNGTAQVASIAVSNQQQVSWSTTASSSFQAQSISAATGAVVDSNGNLVGSGTVLLTGPGPIPVSLSGSDGYNITGTGSLSFYGPAEANIGVSANWDNYSATVTGNVSIKLTTGALTLNGLTLPAGTYTITTSSATLTGSGETTSPNFSGIVAIAATNGTIQLGPGGGNIASGGKPLDSTDGVILDGYSGSIDVSANGDGTDAVTLNGNTANVLQVVPNPPMLATDQNTPVTFQAGVRTSLTDTYGFVALAPPGWTVTIDNSGNVTVIPAPGLQGGTYPVQVVAQSETDPNLVAQTIVNVTVTPTTAGITLAIDPDSIVTVPFNGAQLPTSFRVVIHNNGPSADTYDLALSNIPSGFTILTSATSVTVPAGQTGIVGIYLQPNAGIALPAPGTPLSFTVTATSTTDPTVTQVQTESFTMPTVDAVTIASNPVQVATVPGLPGTATVTLVNVGNVATSAALSFTTNTGLTLSGLTAAPITLAIGQSTTETVNLAPDADVPLNSTLQATVNVGPASLQNVVSVVNVTPSSSFAEAGQTVTVSADVLNAVTATEQAEASFTA
jgi:hypothetical protein